MDENEELLDAITALIPSVLTALEAFAYFGRHMHPGNIQALVLPLKERVEPVEEGLKVFKGAPWPDHLQQFADQISEVAGHVISAIDGLKTIGDDEKSVFRAYRVMRYHNRAVESLYPIALMLPPVSRFFVEPGRRDDAMLQEKLAKSDPRRENVGIIHMGNDKESKGGFSLYVPEYYEESDSSPLIVALHGGSGHGRDFLWTWLREARSYGAILVSPTSKGDTWSLMGPDVDSPNLHGIVKHVQERWNVDSTKMLLTGMSDGGTFTYVSGLDGNSPFTHLAPSSASFHPLLIEGYPPERIQGLPIYLMHGALDWMFPIDVARTAHQTLSAAGAKVCYREISDLSHTYPRDENPNIMNWFLYGTDPSTETV